MFLALFNFIGFQEITVILLISVLVFGPKKIPEIARGLGQGLRAMREATDQIKKEVMDSVDGADVSKEIKDTQKEIESEISKAKKDLDDVVGPITRKKF